MIVPSDLVPFFCANLRLMSSALWRGVAGRCLAWAACLCSSFQSFKAEVLHARLLLMLVSHGEGPIPRALRLELQLGRLRHRHLVIGKGSGSGITNTSRIGATVLVHVEVLLHIVVGGVVRG